MENTIDVPAILRAAASQSMLAENTRKAYAVDWGLFTRWCQANAREFLPASADTLITYLSHRIVNGGRVTSAVRAVSAINHYHKRDRVPAPGGKPVTEFLTGVRRLKKEKPVQKLPVTIGMLRDICGRLGDDPRDIRARAIITLGFASSLRRSNIAALNMEDVRFVPQGLTLRIGKEKTDQEGNGRTIGVAQGQSPGTCPVMALKSWIALRGPEPGPLFVAFNRRLEPTEIRIAARSVALFVKRAAQALGFDRRDWGAHSLRAGFVTAAVLAGAGEFVICEQTGHKSLVTLRKYYRNIDPFARNASALLGL